MDGISDVSETVGDFVVSHFHAEGDDPCDHWSFTIGGEISHGGSYKATVLALRQFIADAEQALQKLTAMGQSPD